MNLQPGDILAFSGHDWFSYMINLATLGRPGVGASHVAIVGASAYNETRSLIYESTTLCKTPCYYQRKCVSGVQAHLPTERVSTYPGTVKVYRLVEPLTGIESKALTRFLRHHIGKGYDSIGAFRSRSFGFWARFWQRKASLESIFCSEYCMAALKSIGRINDDDPSFWNPNRMIQHLLDSDVLHALEPLANND